MFMEYVALGPVVRRNPKTNCFTSSATGHICEEAAAGRYLLDITSGIRYLHLHNIAHRDLKPDNVLLGGNGICKIADFGVAHHFEEDLAKQKLSPCPTVTTAKYFFSRLFRPVSMQSLERSHSRAQIRETQGTYCFWAPEMLEVVISASKLFACN
jgi:serine/threonine protein kinase